MIKGLQKTTLVDYPGKVASTVFIAGCNMRCGFCHNKDLVVDHSGIEEIPLSEVLSFLESRKDKLDGVCITGGEPTLWPGLPELCRGIKKLGLAVKLDTNGTTPSIVKKLVAEGLIDYIAMDLKSSLANYQSACGAPISVKKIAESIAFIKSCGVDYEFRTTIVPDIHDSAEIEAMKPLLQGAKHYALQQYQPAPTTIDPKYHTLKPLSVEALKAFKEALSGTVPSIEIRNT